MSNCDPALLASLVGGSVDPTSKPSHPRILTDFGTIRLGLRVWYMSALGNNPPPLAPWNASADDVAKAFRVRVGLVAA